MDIRKVFINKCWRQKKTQFIHKIQVYLVLAQNFLPLLFKSDPAAVLVGQPWRPMPQEALWFCCFGQCH